MIKTNFMHLVAIKYYQFISKYLRDTILFDLWTKKWIITFTKAIQ